jgi:hypothetical protein
LEELLGAELDDDDNDDGIVDDANADADVDDSFLTPSIRLGELFPEGPDEGWSTGPWSMVCFFPASTSDVQEIDFEWWTDGSGEADDDDDEDEESFVVFVSVSSVLDSFVAMASVFDPR